MDFTSRDGSTKKDQVDESLRFIDLRAETLVKKELQLKIKLTLNYCMKQELLTAHTRPWWCVHINKRES